MAEKHFIDANGSYTLNATDNTGYCLCFGGGIISVCNHFGSVVAEFDAYDAPTVSPTDTPTADVVEVAHARWIWNEENECFVCSNCELSALNDYRGDSTNSNYCPNCGAKMNGERENDGT